jgi:hypothetical protein
MKKLEQVQRKITKYKCFKMDKIDDNYIERLNCLELLPLSVRREVKNF